ncbi:MAG: hypothetical protein ACK462_16105, partial [Planctomyces sp.]
MRIPTIRETRSHELEYGPDADGSSASDSWRRFRHVATHTRTVCFLEPSRRMSTPDTRTTTAESEPRLAHAPTTSVAVA